MDSQPRRDGADGQTLLAQLAHVLAFLRGELRCLPQALPSARRRSRAAEILSLIARPFIFDYMDVDEDVVWKTCVDEVPRLVSALEPLVRG